MKVNWQIVKGDLLRVAPLCFVIGASMELFMIKTGFYSIVTRKEAERRLDRMTLENERRRRLEDLKILDPKNNTPN